MTKFFFLLKYIFLAIAILFASQSYVYAQSPALNALFERLLVIEASEASKIEEKIMLEWSRSGSPAMDIIFDQAKTSLSIKAYSKAMVHLNALTDHAPGFVEGWSLSAVAFQKSGKIGPALASIEQVLMIEPRHFHALAILVIILEDLGLFFEALEVVNRIESIHPHFVKLNLFRRRLEIRSQGQAL